MNINTSILDRLLDTVVSEVPASVRAFKSDEPVVCLHLVYYDTHAPCAYIDLKITTKSKRAELYAEDPGDFWDGWGEPGNYSLGELGGDNADSSSESELFVKLYDFISEDGKMDENMKLYHDTLARAAYKINETLPEDFTGISDDFVVVLGDGSRWTGGCDPDDVLDCVPPEKLRLLVERGFWDADINSY
ncbi:MAG: hypothetical protein AAFN77_24355 [Planctomycetota bacterium]